MIVAANMAFANIKGVARDPKDYEVYQPKVITKEVIKEVPVEVEKIVEKEVIKEVPVEKIVERIIEVEKPIKTQETSMYKPPSTSKKKSSPPPNNPWGSPGGSR
jgi:hypothetical protein